MIRIALQTLRFRLGSSAASFVAILLGCAILVACGGIFETALRLHAQPERYSGAPIIVAPSDGYRLNHTPEVVAYSEQTHLDSKLHSTANSVPGVDKVIADMSFPARLVSGNAPAQSATVGHNWEATNITPYVLKEGRAPRINEVALDVLSAKQARAKSGDQLTLLIQGKPQMFTVSGIVASQLHVSTGTFFFNDQQARKLSGHQDSVNAFAICPDEDISTQTVVANLRKALPPDTRIVTSEERGGAEFLGVSGSRLPLLVLGGVFTGMVIVVMILVVSATIGLSVKQRQQELALLRASGATPRQVRRMVVAETMAVALLAVAAGLYLGHYVGSVIFTLSAAQGIVPPALRFQQGIIPLVGAGLLTVIISWATARVSAAPAANTRPVQAMNEVGIPLVTVSRVRRIIALIFAVVTVGLAGATLFLDPETASAVGGPASLTGAIVVGLVAPEILYFLVNKLGGVAAKRSYMHTLAVINVRARSAQYAAVLTPLTIAIALTLGNIYSQTTQNAGALSGYLKQFNVNAVVGSTGDGIAPEVVTKVRTTPGVESVSALIVSQGWIEKPFDSTHGSDPWRLLGFDAQGANTLTVPVVEGALQDVTGESVALPQGIARKLGLHLGDMVGLRLGDGATVTVKVKALLNGPADYASMLLPASLLAPHTSSGLPVQILVRTDDTRKTSDVLHAIANQTKQLPGIYVGGRDILASNFAAGLNVQAWISYLLALLATAYAAIATINALVVIIAARKRELAMQRLVGATRAQVRHMLFIEGLLVAGCSLVCGTIVAAFTALPMAPAVGLLLPAGSPLIYVGTVAITLLIVLPIVKWAGNMTTKQRPIEAISLASD